MKSKKLVFPSWEEIKNIKTSKMTFYNNYGCRLEVDKAYTSSGFRINAAFNSTEEPFEFSEEGYLAAQNYLISERKKILKFLGVEVDE